MRLTFDHSMMEIAHVLARRTTCPRRGVGCVLVNDHNNIVATGYNGTPRGAPHCTDVPCDGAASGHGADLDLCRAIHAEQNALLQCKDVHDIRAIYVTAFPCMHCFKMLTNTSCRQIYFDQDYPATMGQVLAFNQHLKKPMEFWKIAAGSVSPATRVGATPRS